MESTQVSVRDVREVGGDTVAITLTTPASFEADPGEFVLVRATVDGEEIARHYTLSSPTVEDTFEITVGVDPEGDLTPYLANLDPGTQLEVEGPFGTFAYTGDEDVLVLAGGPGVGAAVAIGERARSADRDATIVYLDETPVHEVRLSQLAADGASISMASDEAGFRDAVASVADGSETYVFGFQEFCELATEALADAGVDPDEAKVESFG